MFRFSRGFRGADFGNLGSPSEAAQSSTDDGGSGSAVDSSSAVAKTASDGGSGGILTQILPTVNGVSNLASNAGLCGCANKDKAAEDSKKAELARKYPFRDCGKDTGAVGYATCMKYNEDMQKKRDQEFLDWADSKDKDTSSQMSATDKEKFGAISMIAKKFKALHPEAGNMTISQIRKKYPDDFDKIYASVQASYPFLKGIDADTALAMAPGINDMTLDGLIHKLDIMATPAAQAASKAGVGGVVGILALLGVAAFVVKKRLG